jgi:ATP-dependent DNA helicase RecG
VGIILMVLSKSPLNSPEHKRVIKEIRTDMGSNPDEPFIGDVGSGKTIVAFMSMLLALDNGFQACLMAPTEILANQHFIGLSELANELNINIKYLQVQPNIC